MAVDAFFNHVSLLLHCEGSNGSTTFTDSSPGAKTVAANGNANISTAQFKFGGSSGLFDGSDDYLSVSDGALDLGSGDFTIEFWLRITNLSAVNGLFFNGTLNSNNSRFQIDVKTTGTLNFFAANSTPTAAFSVDSSAGAIAVNTWYHVAAVRSGSTAALYINGASVGTATVGNEPGAGNAYYIGYARNGGLNRYLTGYLDDLRVTKGQARYTGNFTPPAAAFPDEQGNDLPTSSLTWTAQPLNQSGALIQDFLPAESLAWAAQPLIITPVLPAESLVWTGQLLSQQLANDMPAESIAWTSQLLSGQLSHSLSVIPLTWAAQPLQQTYDAPSYAASRAVYRCYLTGDAEIPAIADIELPLSSFQSTRRNGEQTYLAITVPNPVPYIDGINARLNGDIVIYSGFAIGDTETLTELLRVNFGSFRYDLGARSGSVSLSGHKQVTYTNPKTRALQGVSYKSVTDGIRRARGEPDMWLNPGDTVDLGDESFVVDAISYIVSPRQSWMEVSEVEA